MTVIALTCASAGCTLHYYDAATGVEHIWGFGHMALREVKSSDGDRLVGVAYGTDLFGVAVGRLKSGLFAGFGWQQSHQLDIARSTTAISAHGPTAWPAWLHYAYGDPDAGRHVWGVGHFQMRPWPPEQEAGATVRDSRAMGFGAGGVRGPVRVLLGWEHTHSVEIADPDLALRVEWPSTRLLDVSIGSRFPENTEINARGEERDR